MTKDATSRKRWGATVAAATALFVLPLGVHALQNPEVAAKGKKVNKMAMFHDPAIEVKPSTLHFKQGSQRAMAQPELQNFFSRFSRDWDVQWDERSDRPHLIQGAGIPLIPGKGNSLTRKDLGLSAYAELQVADVEPLLRNFMDQYPELFRIGQNDLVLDQKSAHVSAKGQRYWSLEFQQMHRGVPVEGARVFFRINNGNIIQFGSDKVADVRLRVKPKMTRGQAFRTVLRSAGFRASEVSEWVERGALKILPVMESDEIEGEPFAGAVGEGYSHRLVWEYKFRRTGDVRTYHAIIDAHNGQMLQLFDVNAYATVTGGIYPVTNLNAEVVRPFSFANLSIGGNTDSAGVYNYPGGTVTVSLNGKYFRMSDACGAISLAADANGNINFGTSGGTDCTTPGVGGAGNTHASRSGFYHLTNINRKAAQYLPSNSWLATNVTSNMNINQTCNAFWNGSTVNFYRSGGGCSNTGELAAVFLHEWGHGMDTNTGGAASGDQGSGEAVGDTFAFLETRDGCIGHNFLPGEDCTNCVNCTGVRDVEDFAQAGGAGSLKIAKPANVAQNTGLNCDAYTCVYTGYRGPMGYEGHCEAVIAGSANWDLAKILVAAHGETAGWATMDSIWYESLNPSKSAYRVVSGGTCNPNAVVDGGAATNWYTVYLGVDDDNGNLTDGTPNGCRIWDAFNLHGIAAGTRPACSGGGGPTPTPVPPTATPTRTNTPTGPTNTPTRTNTPVPPTSTPTPIPGGNCATVNASIPDNNATGVSSTVNPTGSATITDVNVQIVINHTYIGDVKATLTHAGRSAAILDRPGVPASTYGCAGDNINTTLDDEAATAVEGICGSGTPAISGTYRPNVALTTFDGTSISGGWTLTVTDAVGSDVGSLVSWCIVPTTGSGPTATPVPPTATPVPPTSTPVPPTATPVPPTATPTGGSCGGTTVTGSLSGGGDADLWPSSAGFSAAAGTHIGQLTGTSAGNPDFDLYLQKKSGSTWQNVAQSIGSTDDEFISNTNTAGTYRWRVASWSGSGNYNFCYVQP